MTERRFARILLLAATTAAGACAPTRLAEAAGDALGVEEAARLIADESRIRPDTQVVRVVAELWVDYTILAHALAADSTLADLDVGLATRGPLDEMALGRLQAASIHVDSTLAEADLRAGFAADMPGARATASHLLLAFPPGATAVQRDSVNRLAESLRERAEAGEDFATLVMGYSSDPGSARYGGRLGTFARGVMLPPIDEAVFSMSPGEIVGPVETELGLHVIKLEALDMPAFEEAGGAYRAQLLDERRTLAEEAYVNELEQTAGLALADGALEAMRALARAPEVYLTPRARQRPLATFEGGAYTAGDFQMVVRNPAPGLLQRIPGLSDQELTELATSLARQQLLVHEARSQGLAPTDAEVDSVATVARDRIRTLARRIGLAPDTAPAPDSAGGAAASPALAAVQRVISGEQDIIPLGAVTFLLRAQFDWRIHEEAVRATLARARGLEGT